MLRARWSKLTTRSNADTSTFHTYELRTYRGTQRYDLFVDGVWRYRGEAPITSKPPRLLFGDSTPSGGDCRMRFKEIRLVNWGYVNEP